MVDGEIKDEIKFGDFNIPDNFMDSEKFVFGCSLELENPSPFVVSSQAIGRSLTKDECIAMTRILTEYFEKCEELRNK